MESAARWPAATSIMVPTRKRTCVQKAIGLDLRTQAAERRAHARYDRAPMLVGRGRAVPEPEREKAMLSMNRGRRLIESCAIERVVHGHSHRRRMAVRELVCAHVIAVSPRRRIVASMELRSHVVRRCHPHIAWEHRVQGARRSGAPSHLAGTRTPTDCPRACTPASVARLLTPPPVIRTTAPALLEDALHRALAPVAVASPRIRRRHNAARAARCAHASRAKVRCVRPCAATKWQSSND